jgi:hypothetical protein
LIFFTTFSFQAFLTCHRHNIMGSSGQTFLHHQDNFSDEKKIGVTIYQRKVGSGLGSYAMAFNSTWALSTISEPGCQSGCEARQRAFNFSSQGWTSFSFDFPTIMNATGMPFSHSSKTMTVYNGYCRHTWR